VTCISDEFQLSYISSTADDDIKRLKQGQDDREHREERQAILKWLSSIDYGPQQRDFFNRRQQGTGEWLLNSNEFSSWVKQSKQTLFCPGIPGAGKTIMSSIVVDYLEKQFGDNPVVGIAYIYCSYQPRQEQTPEDLISNLLKQFIETRTEMPNHITALYKDHHKNNKPKGSRPSLDEIINAFQSTFQLYSRGFIIIDALDEYHSSNNKGLQTLLSAVFSLARQADVNFFATSRPVSEITSRFQDDCLTKEIRACDDDILCYVNGRMHELLRSEALEHPDLEVTIRKEILNAADGMYVHACPNILQNWVDVLFQVSTCPATYGFPYDPAIAGTPQVGFEASTPGCGRVRQNLRPGNGKN